jgi:hypothetical protein
VGANVHQVFVVVWAFLHAPPACAALSVQWVDNERPQDIAVTGPTAPSALSLLSQKTKRFVGADNSWIISDTKNSSQKKNSTFC